MAHHGGCDAAQGGQALKIWARRQAVGQVVAGLQQSQAAISVVQEAELWNASVQMEAQLKQEQMCEQAHPAAFKSCFQELQSYDGSRVPVILDW